MSKTTKIISRILLLIYIGLLAYLCFGHFDHVPQIIRKFWGIEQDKVIHFCMFFPFPILAYFSVGKIFRTYGRALTFVLIVFLIGCLIGAATELGQGLTTYRSADPKDFSADALALAASSVLSFIICIIQRLHHSDA